MAIEDTEHSMAGTRPRQPDKYHGQRDFLLLDNWSFSVDQYFLLTDTPANKQGPFVSTLLRDEALLWYRSSYEKWDTKTPLTWEIIRTAMRQYFAPPNEDRRLQDEWANLRQHFFIIIIIIIIIRIILALCWIPRRGLRVSIYHMNEYPPSFLQSLIPKEKLRYAV